MDERTPASAQARILIVEDDRSLRSVMVRNLGARGFIVDEVGTMTAALERIDHVEPCLVFLDIELPDGTGSEFLPYREGPPPPVRCRHRLRRAGAFRTRGGVLSGGNPPEAVPTQVDASSRRRMGDATPPLTPDHVRYLTRPLAAAATAAHALSTYFSHRVAQVTEARITRLLTGCCASH